jgi:predicted nucleotidyltransferase
MIQDSDRKIVSEFRSRLEAIIPILDLRVFGSRARGDATEESDLNVFIKVAELDRSSNENIVYPILSELTKLILPRESKKALPTPA